jgi:hypothetical protein
MTAQILAVSYAQDLADKLARECRALISSPFFKALFPTRLSPNKQAVGEFETTAKGYRLSTSVGGVLTGRGADYIIIDHPMKPEEALSGKRADRPSATGTATPCTAASIIRRAVPSY